METGKPPKNVNLRPSDRPSAQSRTTDTYEATYNHFCKQTQYKKLKNPLNASDWNYIIKLLLPILWQKTYFCRQLGQILLQHSCNPSSSCGGAQHVWRVWLSLPFLLTWRRFFSKRTPDSSGKRAACEASGPSHATTHMPPCLLWSLYSPEVTCESLSLQ